MLPGGACVGKWGTPAGTGSGSKGVEYETKPGSAHCDLGRAQLCLGLSLWLEYGQAGAPRASVHRRVMRVK